MSVDLQAFARWNAAVDAAFRTAGRPLRTKQIRVEARIDAFKAGMTPMDFAALPSPPLADNPKIGPLVARGCLWSIAASGLILVVLLALGPVLLPSPPTTSETPSGLPEAVAPPPAQVLPTENAYEVSAERLARAYKENEVAANGQFAGKLIAVKGVVHSVTDDPPTVELATDTDLQMSFNNVLCEFDPTWRRDIARLGPGRMVRIVGIVKGAAQGFRPRLVKCSFD